MSIVTVGSETNTFLILGAKVLVYMRLDADGQQDSLTTMPKSTGIHSVQCMPSSCNEGQHLAALEQSNCQQ